MVSNADAIRHAACESKDCECLDSNENCVCPVVAAESVEVTAIAQDVTLGALKPTE